MLPSIKPEQCLRALRRPIAYRLHPLHTPSFANPYCVCCGIPTSGTLQGLFGSPHCEECFAHAERASTRRLAVTLASCIVGGAVALALPLLSPSAGWVQVGLLSLAAALAPLLVDLLWFARVKSPHTTADHAVWRAGPDVLWCSRRGTARDLLRASAHGGTTIRATRVALRRFPWWMFSGAVLATPLALAAHTFYHPVLRVLNLSGRSLTLLVDGVPQLTLGSTSSESPLAGAQLRIAAGEHELSVHSSSGQPLAHHRVRFTGGRYHLYAPLSEQCFWLETTGYGREAPYQARRDLPRDPPFWPLPDDIDLWLTAAPTSEGPSRLSGGQLTALRQGPCDAAP